MSKELANWADDFMFKAEESDAVAGPQAFLISATPDPLGSIAVAAEAYMGRFYEDKSAITDEQRRYYLAEMQKTKLKMPMEAVSLHWRLKGVTRSFTHQMVRQRTAAYSQESMRFAVKEDAATAVALPPSLQRYNELVTDMVRKEGVATLGDYVWDRWRGVGTHPSDWEEDYPSHKQDRWYIEWREGVEYMASKYSFLVNDGMPAEDARGLTPHNIVTQLNYITNLRNYHDHAGNRLCTQAQFEWRIVWVRMLEAMRKFCTCPGAKKDTDFHTSVCDNWQWIAISELFRPVCYYTGNCQFLAEFDRKCSIRDRVMANAKIGRPSSEWEHDYTGNDHGDFIVGIDGGPEDNPVYIGAIHPAEWLTDAAAAR